MKSRLLPALRTLANAYADEHRLARAPRMRLVRRGARIRLRTETAAVDGHIAAPTLLVGDLVAEASGRRLRGRPMVWKPAAGLWWKSPAGMIALAAASLARGRIDDARDLAYLGIVETLYLEDVEAGTSPTPPADVLALVANVKSPADQDGAHLTILRGLVARLPKARRGAVVPLLRAMADVVGRCLLCQFPRARRARRAARHRHGRTRRCASRGVARSARDPRRTADG